MLNYRNVFPSQQKDESIFIFMRRDLLNFLPTALIIMFLFFFGLLLLLLLALPGSTIIEGSARNIAVVFVGLFMLIIGLFAFVSWLDFYFDVHILTSFRLVDIDQNRLFSRNYSELALDDVEDVRVTQTGILETIANFGSVEVQTAGERPNFLLDKIPYPKEVAALIIDLSEQAKAGINPMERFPRGTLKGILDGRMVTSANIMKELDAVVPEQSTTPVIPAHYKPRDGE